MHFSLSLFTTALLGFTSVLAAPVSSVTRCNLDGVALDSEWLKGSNSSIEPLVPPTGSQKLARLLLGVGTQNYSCVNGVATPNGAVAVLYDLSCAATVTPEWADVLTRAGLQAPPNVQSQSIRLWSTMMNIQLTVGYHYFKGDFATPAFEFNDGKKFYGGLGGKVTAFATADKGRQPDAYGAVPYLRINAKAGMGSHYSIVYRLQTAGGSPPPGTCNWTGQKKIPYAAQYWVYT